ncbi:hypothetical protein LIL_13239 [Leptospira interrogans serovar Linhai str. 56609]|nr:hypothetical protein LIL_13239 [Leptospira interrogans serovar Linhai str. 56609]
MNSPSVSILCKSAIGAVLLIGTMEFFNNSNKNKMWNYHNIYFLQLNFENVGTHTNFNRKKRIFKNS